MTRQAPRDVTTLLRRWRRGDRAAQEELWPVLYHELKGLARSLLRRQAGRPPEGASTLVHEAYLRMVGSASEVPWNDRSHFFAMAARAMRFILVDHARRRLAKKREAEVSGGEIPREAVDPASHRPEAVIAVHQALERLARINPRHEKLVEMRYFAGFSIDESAELLEVSRPTAVRDWRAVRIWLFSELQAGSERDAGEPSGP